MQYRNSADSPPLSPCSQMAPLPFSVTDLSYRMSQYSLQQQGDSASTRAGLQTYSDSSYFYSIDISSTSTEPSSPASTISSASISTPPSSFLTTSSSSSSARLGAGYHSTNVRQQRQRALRRQCSASHLREISALVARMVTEGDQCSVSPTAPNLPAMERTRQNSDPTSEVSSTSGAEFAVDDDAADSMEEDFSEPESFNDTCEGYPIQESSGLVDWNCPWSSKARTSDGRRCITKDTRSRRRTKRHA